MEYIQKFSSLPAVSSILRRPLIRIASSFSTVDNIPVEDKEKHEVAVSNDEPVPDLSNPFQREKQKCILCRLNIRPDWKNTRLLSQFQSPFTGRIYGRHITGLCVKKQAEVVKEIEKAQMSGFMPYYLKEPIFMRDPKLYNPEKPIRPHPY